MKVIEEVSGQKTYMKIKKSKRNMFYKDTFFYYIYRKFVADRLTD